MKNAKKLLSLVLAVVMLATSAFALASCSGNGNEILIGGTGPLTGENSVYGIAVQRGAQIAVNEINAAGGVNGITFKLQMLDDQAGDVQAAANYDTLVDAGMKVSLGGVTSGSCYAFAEKANKDNMFFITPSASRADIVTGSPNSFRVCFGDPDQATISAAMIREQFPTGKVGCIYDTSDSYSKGIYDVFAADMAENDFDFQTQTFDANNKSDFTTQVNALKDCDVIFLPIYYEAAALIAQTAASANCEALLFGCDGLDGIKGQLANATVSNTIKYITPFDVAAADEKTKNFVTAYKAAYGEDPNQFAADAYDCVYAIAQAMEKADVTDASISASDLSNKLVAAFTAQDFKFVGTTGTMTWNAEGEPNKTPVVVTLGQE